MEEERIKASTGQFEKLFKDAEAKTYVLRLYVHGETPKSLRAIENINRICREHLAGRYELEIIDAASNPEKLEQDQVLAIPALIKKLPEPLRQLVGDLSDRDSVLIGLNLLPKGKSSPSPS